MRLPRWLLAALLLALIAAGVAVSSAKADPLVIAEGGATCAFPVGTLEAFKRSIDEGADFLAITVVSTKDGNFIVRPSLMLGSNTNVKELRQFNDKKRSIGLGDGRKASGYLASDFTLAEIDQLRAIQSFDERDQSKDGRYRVPTLGDVLDLVQKANQKGKEIGVIVQVLDPGYHVSANLATYTQVLAALLSAGFKQDFAKRVRIQSYDIKVLTEVADQMQSLGLPSRESLIWMIHCSNTQVDDEQLMRWSRIGAAIAPEKELLQQLTFAEECGKLLSPPCWKTGRYCTGKLQQPLHSAAEPHASELLARAHAAGLAVYPFTFRNEGRFMAVDFGSDLQQELDFFAGPQGMGVDGLYTDCTRTTSEWLRLLAATRGGSFGALPASVSSAAEGAAASASNAAASVAAAASKAASNVKAASIKTWAFGIVAGVALLTLFVIGLFALIGHRRRANQYRAWKEAGLSQALDADLPVSTGAVWGLEKNTWSSQASEAADEQPASTSRASSIASHQSAGTGSGGRRDSRGLKTYSGMLDSYAHSARR